MVNFQIPNPADIADGQFLQWNTAQGRFLAVDTPSGAAPGQIENTSAANQVDSGGSSAFLTVGISADFAERFASLGWTFDPAGCIFTCTVAGRYLFRVIGLMSPAMAPGGAENIYAVFAKNNDFVNEPPGNTVGGTRGGQQVIVISGSVQPGIIAERVIQAIIGDTVTPCFAYTGGENLTIPSLTIIVQ